MKNQSDIFNYTAHDSVTEKMICEFFMTHHEVEYLVKQVGSSGLTPLRIFEPKYAVIAIIRTGVMLPDSIFSDIVFDVRNWFYYCDDMLFCHTEDEKLKNTEWSAHILIGIKKERATKADL